jgi:hypothetical protein
MGVGDWMDFLSGAYTEAEISARPWNNQQRRGQDMPKQVPVGGVWLLTTADRLKVLVEVDGVWRVAIDEPRPFNCDGTPVIVSDCAHATGFASLPSEPTFAE